MRMYGNHGARGKITAMTSIDVKDQSDVDNPFVILSAVPITLRIYLAQIKRHM